MASRSKRRRSTVTAVKKPKVASFVVEEVIGYKLEKQKLLFYIKWQTYDPSYNTWEPLDNLERCTVYENYINSKFLSMEKDIYVNICNIKQRLKKRIRETARQLKAITMFQIQPFDPFEFKVYQVFALLLPPDEAFLQRFEDMVLRSHFFKLDQVQRIQNDRLLEYIRKKDGDISLTIENEVDFEPPPEFEYVTENVLTDKVYVIEPNIRGCECKTCSKESNCCPKRMKERFPYKQVNGRITVTRPDTIIECGTLCKCGTGCINRVSQRPSKIPLCLFKTKSRGWGVKAAAIIPKNTFIVEYVGELIGQEEADARTNTAYLFDMKVEDHSNNFYTVDALYYGNISRFINHACEPNIQTYHVSNCNGHPNNLKLCFFSTRQIAKGEELTLDYTGGAGLSNVPRETMIPCTCGAKNCRGMIY